MGVFFAAVWANPDDDLPRLVLADWLNEHGEHDRADFIRVQCELAGVDCGHPQPDVAGCQVCELRRRERRRWPIT